MVKVFVPLGVFGLERWNNTGLSLLEVCRNFASLGQSLPTNMGDSARDVALSARNVLLRILVRPLSVLHHAACGVADLSTGHQARLDGAAALTVLESAAAHASSHSSVGERAAFSVLLRRLCSPAAGGQGVETASWLADAVTGVFADGLAAFAACEALQSHACTALGDVREGAPDECQVKDAASRWRRCDRFVSKPSPYRR